MNDQELKDTFIARRTALFERIKDKPIRNSMIDGIYFNPIPKSTWNSRLSDLKLKLPISPLKRKIGFYFNDELRVISRLNNSFGFYLIEHNYNYIRFQDEDDEWVWKYMSTEEYTIVVYAIFNWLSYLKTYLPFKITGNLFGNLLEDLNSDEPLITLNFTRLPIYCKEIENTTLLNISLMS